MNANVAATSLFISGNDWGGGWHFLHVFSTNVMQHALTYRGFPTSAPGLLFGK